MAVASMRDHTFENEDIIDYILYFFAFWGVVSATVNYSKTRSIRRYGRFS